MHKFKLFLQLEKPDDPLPKRIFHVNKNDFNDHFTITEGHGAPLYTMTKDRAAKKIAIFRPPPPTDTSIDATASAATCICLMHFEKHPPRITLRFHDKPLEMNPIDRHANDFRFSTSRGGDLVWRHHNCGFSVITDCQLEQNGLVQGRVAVIKERDIAILALEDMEREFLDELLISAFAMTQQEQWGYAH